MNISQLDADIAAINSLSGILDAQSVEVEAVLGIIEDISTFGLTDKNFAELKSACPDINVPDVILSSVPVRSGSQVVATEALGGLSAMATAGILTVLISAIGWVISKIFGGDSGGGFGGGSLDRIAEISDAFPGAELSKFITDNGGKTHASLAKISCGSNLLTMVDSGEMDKNLHTLGSALSSLLDQLSDNMDEDAILKLTSKEITSDFNTLVKNNPFVSIGKEPAVIMPSYSTLPELSTGLNNRIKSSNGFKANTHDIDLPSKNPPNSTKEMDKLKKTFTSLRDGLNKADKKIEAAGNKSVDSKDGFAALNATLKYLSKYITGVIISSIAEGTKGIAFTKDIMESVLDSAASILGRFGDEEQEAMLKAAGMTKDDITDLKDKSKPNKDHFEMCHKLLMVIGKSTNVTVEMKKAIEKAYKLQSSK